MSSFWSGFLVATFVFGAFVFGFLLGGMVAMWNEPEVGAKK